MWVTYILESPLFSFLLFFCLLFIYDIQYTRTFKFFACLMLSIFRILYQYLKYTSPKILFKQFMQRFDCEIIVRDQKTRRGQVSIKNNNLAFTQIENIIKCNYFTDFRTETTCFKKWTFLNSSNFFFGCMRFRHHVVIEIFCIVIG